MPIRPFPQRYLREFRHYFHPDDRDLKNPRVLCPSCARWITIHAKDRRPQVCLQCRHNITTGKHLVPWLKKQPLLCNECCDAHCLPQVQDGITELPAPQRKGKVKPPKTQAEIAADIQKKFKLIERAQRTLAAIGLTETTPVEALTDRQVLVLLHHAAAWHFYRSAGDDRACFFLERLQRLAKTKIQ